jgi:hypothetical protein
VARKKSNAPAEPNTFLSVGAFGQRGNFWAIDQKRLAA